MPTDVEEPRNHAEEPYEYEGDDDAADIRYSLTALGEAVLGDVDAKRRRKHFRGFGPCVAVA